MGGLEQWWELRRQWWRTLFYGCFATGTDEGARPYTSGC